MVKLVSSINKEGLTMAIKLTAKKPLSGNQRSHALNATKIKQKPNLQKININGVTVLTSAREAKKFRKASNVKVSKELNVAATEDSNITEELDVVTAEDSNNTEE